jgi:hypothetical protein
MTGLKVIADAAQALTKNPLGVIGLFIILIYGVAALSFGNRVSPGSLESLIFV